MCALAASPAAADVQVTLPVIIAAPGATVDIPISVSPGPAGLGILSIDYHLTLDPAVVASSSVQPNGFIQFWGPPYVNANASFVAAATAGVSPITDTGTLLSTVRLVIKPGLANLDMPLAFATMRLNEGSPAVSVIAGTLKIRSGVGVDDAVSGLMLGAPMPNPSRTQALLAFSAPGADDRARLEVFGLDGRRVRTLFAGNASPGRHELRWDLRDADARPVSSGIYVVRLTYREHTLTRRLAVMR